MNFRVLRNEGQRFVVERGADISYGGLSLTTGSLMPPGSEWNLVISPEDGSVEVPVRARVRHVRSLRDDPPFLVGLKLLDLDAGLGPEYARVVRSLFGIPEPRRQHRRIQVQTEAIWTTAGRPPLQIRLTNLSASGALVEGPNAPPVGQKGEVTLVCVIDGEMRPVPATCVWNRSTREMDRCGLQFAGDDDDRAFVDRVIDGFLFHSNPYHRDGVRPERELFRVGDFDVDKLIAQGGMSEIYRANATRGDLAGRTVALKRLKPEYARDARHADRFRLEADLGRLLQHPAFARVYGVLEFGGEHWMVMDLVEGRDLGQLLAATIVRGVKPPLRTVTGIVGVVLDALDHCHRLMSASGREIPVVHGDVTLSNVMVTPKGEVKLLDFGVASTPDSEHVEGVIAGKLEYLAPELISGGRPAPSADIFQAGILLYETLVGVRPFRGSSVAEVGAAIRRGPVPPSRIRGDIEPPLEELMMAALNPEPRERPPTARAFLNALRARDVCPSEDETSVLVQNFFVRATEVERKPQLLIPGADKY